MPPLCAMTATRPLLRFAGSSGVADALTAGLKVGHNAASRLAKPSEFGPMTIML